MVTFATPQDKCNTIKQQYDAKSNLSAGFSSRILALEAYTTIGKAFRGLSLIIYMYANLPTATAYLIWPAISLGVAWSP